MAFESSKLDYFKKLSALIQVKYVLKTD